MLSNSYGEEIAADESLKKHELSFRYKCQTNMAHNVSLMAFQTKVSLEVGFRFQSGRWRNKVVIVSNCHGTHGWEIWDRWQNQDCAGGRGNQCAASQVRSDDACCVIWLVMTVSLTGWGPLASSRWSCTASLVYRRPRRSSLTQSISAESGLAVSSK